MPFFPYYFLVFSECRSYVYVEETELYYLQSRYYNPEIGRFINADALVSTGQGLLGNNMFAYCGNNPVTNVDYLGYFGICVLDDPMNVNRAFTTPGMFGGGGGSVADVSSSHHVRQNVREYDRYWRNSCYNPNMTWSNGGVGAIGTSANAESGGASAQIPSTVPYPGNDPTRCDVPGFDWRGSGGPGSNKGNFYNLETGEWLHPDLSHPMPIGPHWDYGRRGSREIYRVFSDGTMSLK